MIGMICLIPLWMILKQLPINLVLGFSIDQRRQARGKTKKSVPPGYKTNHAPKGRSEGWITFPEARGRPVISSAKDTSSSSLLP